MQKGTQRSSQGENMAGNVDETKKRIRDLAAMAANKESVILLEDRREVQSVFRALEIVKGRPKVYLAESLAKFKDLAPEIKAKSFFVLDVHLPDGTSAEIMKDILQYTKEAFAIFTALRKEDFPTFKARLEESDIYKGRVLSKAAHINDDAADLVLALFGLSKAEMEDERFILSKSIMLYPLDSAFTDIANLYSLIKVLSKAQPKHINVIAAKEAQKSEVMPIQASLRRILSYLIDVTVNALPDKDQIDFVLFPSAARRVSLAEGLRVIGSVVTHNPQYLDTELVEAYLSAVGE